MWALWHHVWTLHHSQSRVLVYWCTTYTLFILLVHHERPSEYWECKWKEKWMQLCDNDNERGAKCHEECLITKTLVVASIYRFVGYTLNMSFVTNSYNELDQLFCKVDLGSTIILFSKSHWCHSSLLSRPLQKRQKTYQAWPTRREETGKCPLREGWVVSLTTVLLPLMHAIIHLHWYYN